MPNNRVLSDFTANGFYLFESFLKKGAVAKVKDDAKKVFVAQMRSAGIITSKRVSERQFETAMRTYFESDVEGFINCGKTCQHLISLHRLSLHKKLIDKLTDLNVKVPNVCTRPVIYFNSRHLARSEVFYKTPPHQDWRSMQGSLNSIVVWIPLVDIDVRLGALQVIPGSHLNGLLDSEKDEWFRKVTDVKDEDFVSIEVKAGDAVFFSSFLLHRSGDNVTDSIRWSCHFRYNDLEEKTFIERKYPNPYNYAPQQELITPDFPGPDQLRRYFMGDL